MGGGKIAIGGASRGDGAFAAMNEPKPMDIRRCRSSSSSRSKRNVSVSSIGGSVSRCYGPHCPGGGGIRRGRRLPTAEWVVTGLTSKGRQIREEAEERITRGRTSHDQSNKAVGNGETRYRKVGWWWRRLCRRWTESMRRMSFRSRQPAHPDTRTAMVTCIREHRCTDRRDQED